MHVHRWSGAVWAVLAACLLGGFPVFSNSSRTADRRGGIEPRQALSFRISERNPVVNEGGEIVLTAVDSEGKPVSGIVFDSDNQEVALADGSRPGVVRGVTPGAAMITARRGAEVDRVFATVTKVTRGSGIRIPGGQVVRDAIGRLYFSDPEANVIRRRTASFQPVEIYVGRIGTAGRQDGNPSSATFFGPTGLAVDNGFGGGVYVADTRNHAIRKIDFRETITTVIGNGTPGTNQNDITPLSAGLCRSPQGLAIDSNGNLFVADTGNNAIFYVDFIRREMRLLAGEPGTPGISDGRRRTARFTSPTALALTPDGRTLAVIDGNRIRLVSRSGDVSTLGIFFDAPRSIACDALGNFYVVDERDVWGIVFGPDRTATRVSLGQGSQTFIRPMSVFTAGTQVFVLDVGEQSEERALKAISFAPPTIADFSPKFGPLAGGTEITIKGENFSGETRVLFGDRVIPDAVLVSSREVRFRVPTDVDAPGPRSVSVITRGGTAQDQYFLAVPVLPNVNVGDITTIAGGLPFIGDGGAATAATFNTPQRLLADSLGNVFIADTNNHRVRRIDPFGVVTTVAGNGSAGYNGDNLPATQATLNSPIGLALDADGNLMIADRDNHRIRRVNIISGDITTIAGTGVPVFEGDGGNATEAALQSPTGVGIDRDGNIIIADTGNNRLRQIDLKTGTISTIVGGGRAGLFIDGLPFNLVALSQPTSPILDAQGNILFTDVGTNRVRKYDPVTKNVTSVAGSLGDPTDFAGIGDGGFATSARLSNPGQIAFDGSGNLLIADVGNNRLRRVDPFGTIQTLAGNGEFGPGGEDIQARQTPMAGPTGLVVDGFGNTVVTEGFSNRIRRIGTTGLIATLAGTDFTIGDRGVATRAILNFPSSVIADEFGAIYISDTGNNRIRRIFLSNLFITTFAGNGSPVRTRTEDRALATNGSLFFPGGLAFENTGEAILVADTGHHQIRRVSTVDNTIDTVAGTGQAGFSGDNGPAILARFSSPTTIVSDASGTIFVADTGNHRIRRIEGNGLVTTIAGNGIAGFSGDGDLAVNASLNRPSGLALDAQGNLFISDTGNNRIRRLNPTTGIITTVVGNGEFGFSGDGGPAIQARLARPLGLAFDRSGNLLIADSENHRIRFFDQARNIDTIVGSGLPGYSGDVGPAKKARLAFPRGVFVDVLGNILVAGGSNNSVRAVKIAVRFPF